MKAPEAKVEAEVAQSHGFLIGSQELVYSTHSGREEPSLHAFCPQAACPVPAGEKTPRNPIFGEGWEEVKR